MRGSITVVLLLAGGAWGQQAQHQGQHQQQNVGNTVTNSHNNVASGGAGGSSANSYSSSYKDERQTPFAYSPSSIPTAPCRIGKSAGGSSPYFGLAIGGSSDDKECEKRVAAAAFADIGNRVAAARILCTLKAAKDAGLTQEDCVAASMPAPVTTMYVEPVEDAPALPMEHVLVAGPVVMVGVRPRTRKITRVCPVGHQ